MALLFLSGRARSPPAHDHFFSFLPAALAAGAAPAAGAPPAAEAAPGAVAGAVPGAAPGAAGSAFDCTLDCCALGGSCGRSLHDLFLRELDDRDDEFGARKHFDFFPDLELTDVDGVVGVKLGNIDLDALGQVVGIALDLDLVGRVLENAAPRGRRPGRRRGGGERVRGAGGRK